MSTETATPVQMVNVQINGEWRQFPKGTRVIEACGQTGNFIPRYCYHPKLSSPGNCRMCLVEMGMPKMGPERKPVIGADGKPEISWIPRPQISCAQDVAEGMAVRTDSPMVQECRKGVMEFLLINHPLDCPICDQAGECRLQEFSVEYGNAESRFLEHKVKKPKNVELGPRVTLDAERCVLCSRCIRFMNEVAHDDVLGFIDRGSFSTIAVHPGKKLDSNYSLNTVDICPVGALTSTDFRFKMRVWFLKETKSFCTSCATGCNTNIGSRENTVYRQTPRENNNVNGLWMCDYGRLNFHDLNSGDRLTRPMARGGNGLEPVSWADAIARAGSELKALASTQIAVIASGRMTNEELWLTKQLVAALGTHLRDIIPRSGEGDDLLVNADRNPNTTTAKLLKISGPVPGSDLSEITRQVKNGRLKALIVLAEDVSVLGLAPEDLEKLQTLIVVNIVQDSTTRHASIVLPGAGFAEKRGSMINAKGRLQRLNRATNPPGEARDDWKIILDLIHAVSGGNGISSIEDVFKQMAADVPLFQGLSLGRIGDLGVQLQIT
jgi:NADH-quinone oxidoreductase subunit G